jgi:Ca2+-binding EF-hand superfamily protein
MKIDRRKKSLDIMRKSAQSDQIRQMLENTLDECVSTANTENSAEERLQAVMTKAKERGMSADSIFSFFNGGNPNTTQITNDSFFNSIVKLGDSLISITADELTQIVNKFDKNEDGKISIAEFKNYCYYEIPSVAWKAERTRLEKTGEMKMLKAQLSRRFKVSDTLDENNCGEEVCRTSKFFWKTNNNVEIRVFFTEVLNVITLQIYSQTFEKELPSIYVCRNKVAFQHTRYKAEVEQAMQKVESLTDTLEAAEKEASWESISKYVVARLKLWERDDSEDTNAEIPAEIPTEECAHILNDASFIPYLCKLTGESEVLLYVLKVISFNIHSERLFLFVTIRLPQTMHMTPS